MKIATFNINNVNKRLANLLAWLRPAAPDVVCLQELKSTDADFPIVSIRRAGYDAVWRGQKTWNGVAILARGMTPVLTRSELPGDPKDTQSRYIEAAVNGILIGCLYAPNGNPQPGPKFDYKLAWLERLSRHARSLLEEGVPVVVAGDYNVVPTPLDIYETHSYDKDALVQPQSPTGSFIPMSFVLVLGGGQNVDSRGVQIRDRAAGMHGHGFELVHHLIQTMSQFPQFVTVLTD